jgi:hypothetical protein
VQLKLIMSIQFTSVMHAHEIVQEAHAIKCQLVLCSMIYQKIKVALAVASTLFVKV